LLVELNPDRQLAESDYLNNSGILNFILLPDSRNPLLDVTFDGRHLVNGDVVSSDPVIVARLRDDSPFLLLDDPEAYRVFLKYPGDFDFTEIDVFAPEMHFTPATSAEENSAILTYMPHLEDGFYEFRVTAHDRSDNASGIVEYFITFEVIGEQLVTHVEAFPSVFNDHTRFVFTVTGSETPAEVELLIVNAMGQVVRTIDKEEIGRFVGTTEYTWDGSGDSGAPLAGGVYFYSLRLQDALGNNYQHTGPGFVNSRGMNSGKIIIVR
jgi:hypothetical protein